MRGATSNCTVTDPIVTVGTTRRAKVDGNPFPQAPEYTANLTLNYVLPLGDDTEFFASTDWTMQKDFNLFLYESVEFQDKRLLEGGVRVGYKTDHYDFAAFVRNVTNDTSAVGGIDFNNLTGFVNEPRIWGVEAAFKF